ncbi:hypothetical protein [Actinoplanes sp. G11-F43]|uniref:hypothetical protein n=1 Tax=Actinoplanes sp. G11-F43 TaxID=3424130 RepID=UPI003D34AA51
MAGDQNELVVNYVDLWQAGELQLKPLAEHYRAVAGMLFAAEAGIDLLWRPAVFGGPYGPVRGAWQFLADTTVTLLQETAENFAATGEVLVMASREYAEADRVNADSLDAEIDKRITVENRDRQARPGQTGNDSR